MGADTRHIDRAYGDSPDEKSPGTVRLYFQNVNGLPYRPPHQKILEKLDPLIDLQPDYFGLAETNLDLNKTNVKYATTNAIKRTFDRSTITSTTTSDIPFTSHYKPGGTLCTAVGQWASHVADTGQDPHGLGRWSYILLRTRNERGLIIATAYRVCQNARGEQAGPITAYTQQRTLLRDTYTTPARSLGPTLPGTVTTVGRPQLRYDNYARLQRSLT